MGLVMLGSGSEKATDEMLQYAHETQHEKIIRGLAIGLAFLYYGRQEQADSVIEKLLADKVCPMRIVERSADMAPGSYSPLWWHLHCCSGLCWYREQHCCTKTAPCCRL